MVDGFSLKGLATGNWQLATTTTTTTANGGLDFVENTADVPSAAKRACGRGMFNVRAGAECYRAWIWSVNRWLMDSA